MLTTLDPMPSTTSARPGLSRDALVDSAIAIADAEGLEALTLRRMATEHGVTPMAMYRYFADKEALLAALAERILGQVDLAPTDGPWETRLEAHFDALLAAVRPHPEMADLVFTHLLDSDAGLAVAEHALGLLADAGFESEPAAEIGTSMLSALVSLVAAEPGPRVTVEDRAADIRQRRAQLSALDPKRFPHVIAAAAPLADCKNEESYYGRGVGLLVEGVRALAAR